MQYAVLISEVRGLPFIGDDDAADAAIKSILGHIASRMSARDAEHMTARLPAELSYQKLRGRQKHPTTISAERFLIDLGEQFMIGRDQALLLVDTLIHSLKHHVGPHALIEWEDALPDDWADLVAHAKRCEHTRGY